ncbi:DUF1772 domain-containing protein [Sphingomonas sp. NBWT7]|uniref:DUF1772 domain-containing protein n=1 Tax=Sphingomonas sp. NBWT7 TaxID=2596913 RepID=UPI001629F131|nr:DUF1772 domain-containing protein [Sphingomonas sp. NBWT7]QNE32704.1 DUF1772 domain-containing protein [Sphingomonas sp. NBWT7]
MLLPIIALVSAALFSGAATYITLVEHPARLQLEDRPLLAQWQPSYLKALPLQSGLAIVGGLSGFASWYMSGDWRWMIGSLVLLANWPFTLLRIMPTNKGLQAISPADAGPESRNLLIAWGKLHNVRTALGLASTVLFAWSLGASV